MNTSITFDHGKALQDADQITKIMNKVQDLFQRTDAEINNVKKHWDTSTTQYNSAQNAINLYNSYKANFEGFVTQIKNKANDIYKASATYAENEANANKTTDTGFKIGGAAGATVSTAAAAKATAAPAASTATVKPTTPVTPAAKPPVAPVVGAAKPPVAPAVKPVTPVVKPTVK